MTNKQQRRRTPKISPLAFILTLLFLLILAWLYEPDEPVIPLPAPQPAGVGGSGTIDYIFTTPSLVYPDRRGLRSNSPLLDAVIADVDRARASVDVAVFDIDLQDLGDALRRAERRGVRVRLVFDSENLEDARVAALAGELEQAGIAVVTDGRQPFMHNKFIVIDETITWTGSWNMTENDTYRNNNNMLRFTDRQIASFYTQEFAQLHAGSFGAQKVSNAPRPVVVLGAARVRIFFSPKDRMAGEIVEAIEQARRRVLFMTFSYTSDPIGDAMIARAQAGIAVEGVF